MVRIDPIPDLTNRALDEAREAQLLCEFVNQRPTDGYCIARIDAVQENSHAQTETAIAETANA